MQSERGNESDDSRIEKADKIRETIQEKLKSVEKRKNANPMQAYQN